MAISTNGAIITRVTSALYGEYLSNASYTEVKDTAPATVAANFLANDFAGKTDLQVANTMLSNLGLTSITGLNNWLSAQLTAAGSTTAAKGAKLVSILNDYANLTSDPTYGSYATSFNAKVAAGLLQSQTTGAAGGKYATADVVAVVSQSFTLSTDSDTVAGGAGNDTINGNILGSLDNADDINGGAGTDVLKARFDLSGDGATTVSITPVITDVETVNITGFGANNAGDNITLSGSNITGLNTVIIKDDSSTTAGDAAYTVSNVTNAVSVGVAGGQVSAAGTGIGGDITATYSAASIAGTSDSATFVLGSGNAAGYANIVTVAGIETLNIDAANGGGRIADLTAAAAKTINITGAKNVTLASVANSTAVTKIDASTATGNVSIGSNANGGVIDITTSVVTGSGNDTLWFTSANVASTDTIDAGAGTDTLGLVGGLSSTITVNNFEKLRVGDTGSTYDVSKISGTGTSIAAIRVDSTGGNATFTNVASGTAVQVTGNAPGVLSVTTKGTTDTLSLDLDNGTGANADGVDLTTATLTGVTTLNLTSNDSLGQLTGTNANSIGGLTTATVNVTATARTEVTNTRSSAVKIDASASTARVDITATSTTAGTLSGGTGNDSITAGSGNDVISGGAGNDTIVGATGNDNLSGGAGNDVFTFSALSAITASDTIDGGDGVDLLNLTANANLDFTADTTLYTGVTNVEGILVTNSTAARTITVNDSTVAQFGGNLLIATNGDQGHTIDLGSVGASTSKVTVSAALQTTAGLTVKIGSGTETFTGFTAALDDTVTAASPAYLQAADSIDGGAGTNTFTFTGGATGTTYTVTAAQLGALRNFSTITVDDGTDTDTSRFDFTLTDTVLAQNNASNVLTISRDGGDDGKLKVTGTAVSATYSLSLTGADGNDTLIGGAGNDTISGEAGTDSLTGGAGNDTFTADGNAVDTITDFDFGTSTTSVDVINFAGSGLVFTSNAYDTVGLVSAGYSTDVDVYVFNSAAYADVAAVDTALEALSTANTAADKDLVLLWQDTLGRVHVSAAVGADGSDATADEGDEYTVTDYFLLSNVTITGIASLVNLTDIAVA